MTCVVVLPLRTPNAAEDQPEGDAAHMGSTAPTHILQSPIKNKGPAA